MESEDPVIVAKNQLSDNLIETNTINVNHYIPLVLMSMVPSVVCEFYTRIRNEKSSSRYLGTRLNIMSGKVSEKNWRKIACTPFVLNRLRSTTHLTTEMFGSVATIFPAYGVDKLSIIYIVMFSSFSTDDKKLIYGDDNIVVLRTKIAQLEKLVECKVPDKELLYKIFCALSEK
jgi:hypothetical protein